MASGLLVPARRELPKIKRERPAIAVCIPFEEIAYSKWVIGSYGVVASLTDRDHIITAEGAFIDTARNGLVRDALSTDAEYFFFMDSDNLPPQGAIDRLLSHQKDIVGGWYNVKKGKHPCVYDYAGFDEVKQWHAYRPVVTFPTDENAPQCSCGARHAPIVEKRDALGFGCMLIRRRVFEVVPERWFSTDEGGTEDLYFEREALKFGFETWVDWGVHAAHLGIFAV